MKRLVQIVLISALAGGFTAGAVCTLFLNYGDIFFSSDKKTSDTTSKEHFFHRHQPPVPISAPLVRPTPPVVPTIVKPDEPNKPAQEKKAPVSSVTMTMMSDLPSFAPLVRQVIPAVVNISISRNPADREKPSKSTHAVAQKTSQSDDNKTPHKALHHVRKKSFSHSKKSHKKVHHSSRRRIVRPADEDTMGAGSGFIVDPSGLIVTNRHVIGGATRVIVSLSDGRSLPAHLLGSDPMTDIAVIKVDTDTPLPCVTWGDSRQVEIGDWILVAGNPFGFGSSVTAGIISAVGRDLGIGAMDDFIQLDAPINPGNSGGPAFNLHGQVIAVNAAIASPSDGSVGIGFGIPAEIVAPVVEQIEKTGHVDHGWLGVTLNDAMAPMVVEDVDQDGPAWQGGLRKKDAILAMGKVQVKDARTVLRSVAAALPGTVFVFKIKRDNKEMTLSITLGKRPFSD